MPAEDSGGWRDLFPVQGHLQAVWALGGGQENTHDAVVEVCRASFCYPGGTAY